MDCELPDPDDAYDDTDERAEAYEENKHRRRHTPQPRVANFIHMRECVEHGHECICQALQRYGRRRQLKAEMNAKPRIEQAYRDGYNAHARSAALAREMYGGEPS